jgi:hypothetical protein
MSFLLRVALPDVPGSLGTLATAIGAAGANIEAIEIVEHGSDDIAVDDVLLELPTGVMPDSVVSACHRVDGVEVLWISRYAAGANLQLDLEAVEAMSEDPKEAVRRLVDLIPTVFRADWAALVRPDAGKSAEVMAVTPAAPDLDRVVLDWLPVTRAGQIDVVESSGAWATTIVAGVPVGKRGRRVIFMGRRGGPEFLGSELARLAHLAGLASTIARG